MGLNYKYLCNNEILKVYMSSFDNTVSIYTDKEYEIPIEKDQNGKYFMWKNTKIYLDNWIKTSMLEVKQKVESGETVFADELCNAILSDGVENVRFSVPLDFTFRERMYKKSHGEACNSKETICKIEESELRKITDGYKITVVPVEKTGEVIEKDDYYLSDFASLICSGHIKIVA
jgi:hypothetical protein